MKIKTETNEHKERQENVEKVGEWDSTFLVYRKSINQSNAKYLAYDQKATWSQFSLHTARYRN